MKTLALLPLLTIVPSASAQEVNEKLEGSLGQVISTTARSEMLPVTIVMADQVDKAELDAAAILPKADRRAQVVTLLKETANASQASLLEYLDGQIEQGQASGIRPLWIHNVIGVKATPEVILEIADRGDVSYVHHDAPRGKEVLVSTPAPTPAPAATNNPTCGLNLIKAPDVWNTLGITGSGVVVGVIDTGLCLTHPDIANQLWVNPCEIAGNGIDDDGNGFVDDMHGWSFEGNTPDVTDVWGHGSHVAGTVAGDGAAGNSTGVAPDSRVMVLKFINDVSTGQQSVWDCMQYGVDNGADILTASLGWSHQWGPDRATWRAVCENSIAAGVIVLYAAGNEGGSAQSVDDVRTPGDVPDVITIGAVDCSDIGAGFSSRGPVSWEFVPPYNDHPFPPGLVKPDVCAEGVATVSLNFCNGYVTYAGTSMATPHVAGAVALMLQADPSLDQFGVKSILESTAVDLGKSGKDNRYGSGRIDALLAVNSVLNNGAFCPPKLNSCGTFPVIEAFGQPSATSGSGYVIQASNAPGQQIGLLVYGDQGQSITPVLGGYLCVAQFNRAVPVVDGVGSSGSCNGVLSIDMNSFAAGALGGNPQSFLSIPGTTIHTQFWARDPMNSFGALLTAGHSYTVCP